MMDRECGTKQPKTVIAKENLKKPKQTQKKNFRTIRFCGAFVGLWTWYLLESHKLTVVCGISKMLIDRGRYTMMMTNRGRYTMTTDMSFPVESSKGKKSVMMACIVG